MKSFGQFLLAVGITLTPFAAVQAATLDCRFAAQADDDWIRNHIIIKGDLAAQQVTVFDSLLNARYGGPIDGRISANNDTRLTIKWKARNIETRRGIAPRISYTVTIQKIDGSASATMVAPEIEENGRSNFSGAQYSAVGRCRIT